MATRSASSLARDSYSGVSATARIVRLARSQTRIELRNEAARLYGLALDEADLVDCTGNLRVNIHGVVRNDRADARHDNWHIGGL